MDVEIVGKFLSTLPEDDDHPYRTGPWRPQTTEWDADDLTAVEGEIPGDLDGVYLRNTENPLHPALKFYHPFDGDGMVHVVGFRDGKAFYRNRFIRTDGFAAENEAGGPLWPGLAEPVQIAKREKGWGARTLMKDASSGTVTLIEKCSGAVEFEAVATEHRWVIHISGGSVGRGNLTPDREAVGHLGSPFGRAEQMPSRPEVCGDAAEGGQEPLRMPRRFEAFHRPFALSGGLMRVLGAVVQIPRPPVLHRRHELAVGDLVAAQLVGDQHARHVPQALEQLTEESLGRHRVSA
jgi:hypothetical protein